MHLIQILLPLYDNEGHPFDQAVYRVLQRSLTERFGGATAYLRAPARGTWKEDDGEVVHDDVVVLEVMAEEMDREYWAALRLRLEETFKQDEIVIRATLFERL